MGESNTLTPQRSKALPLNSTKSKKFALLLEDYAPVSVFVATQARQKGDAEQIFCKRLVGKHHGGHVIDGDTTEFDAVDRGARRFDPAVGRYCGGRVIARPRTNSDPRSIRFTQHDERGAGIDDEIDAPAFDSCVNLKVTKAIRFNHQATS